MKHTHFNGSIDQNNHSQLVKKLSEDIKDPITLQQLQLALDYVVNVSDQSDSRPSALDVALTLKHLGVNAQMLVATLLSDPRLRDKLDSLTIDQEFNKTIASLVSQVNWLNTFKECSNAKTDIPEEAEALRRLLLATVDDVRAVLIKLAFRIQRLRGLKQESKEIQQCIAKETMDIYAPLANRLGIAELKWEMEDLAFRYIQPDAYMSLAKSMDDKRADRERYINEFVLKLQEHVSLAGINAQPYGRPKHLFSIHKKMQKKRVELHELADLLAVRIIVKSLSDCYLVLGIVHNLWKHLPHEFDDYIANPKDNGYQSIHTAIIDSGKQIVEIQIRTQEMHDFSEHGVAAHWRYKEGSKQDLALERSITVLRKLLENRDADDDLLLEEFKADFFSDRVMVLTPKKEVVDLPKGATALDFAYSIHTEVGHHCSGAIVNGDRVPLSYPLKSGECIDILNDPNSSPHLYWLDHRKNFVKTIKAKSRIRQWFKARYKDNENKPIVSSKNLQGIGNHKVSTASCCRAELGDRIIGNLLPDQSILIHRFDCQKINNKNSGEHLIELSWGEEQPREHISIYIDAFDRQGLLQDITTLLNQVQANVLKANTETDVIDQSVTMKLTIELSLDSDIELILKQISRIANVFNAYQLP
jgi:GTP pyrophosphokinase